MLRLFPLLSLALAVPAGAAPEPPHIPVVLKPHGKVRVAIVNGTTGTATRVYKVASGTGRNLVINLATRSSGPVHFVVEPENGGAYLFDSEEGGRAASIAIEPNAEYEIRVFNAEKHPQAKRRTGYTLRIQTF